MNLIIHHWDSDGICSASLIAKYLLKNKFSNSTLPIGEYKFDERIRELIMKSKAVYLADLNVPHEVERINKRTLFFDHHIQPEIKNKLVEQINPSINGRNYPSCAMVVSEYLNAWDLETLLGTVGDIGKTAFRIPEMQEIMRRVGISKAHVLNLVELIDSNHISGNREGVENAVRVLIEKDWKDMLEYEPWLRQKDKIECEVERVLSMVERDGKSAFLQFESNFNIISRVARVLVWEMGFEKALVINRDFNGKAQLYCRVSRELAMKRDIMDLIPKLKSFGIAGGKEEVVGCIFHPEKIDQVIQVVKSYMEGLP